MTRGRKFAAAFAVIFIVAYFVFVFTYMSRFGVDQPLPVSVRWIPLASIIAAMAIVAILSRNPKRRP